MIFTPTSLSGAFVVDLEPRADERGFFARSFCGREFAAHGLKPVVAQANVSFNHRKGTVRGLHFQLPPAAETKFIRCTRGRILDVIVDLRPESSTYLRHVAVELSDANRRGLYVPERFAHGFQSLEDRTEITYMVGEYYTPSAELGLRYSDPRLCIVWPLPVTTVSSRDASWPLLDEGETESRVRACMAPLAAAGA